VTDFGLSIEKDGIGRDSMMDDYCGTPMYMCTYFHLQRRPKAPSTMQNASRKSSGGGGKNKEV